MRSKHRPRSQRRTDRRRFPRKRATRHPSSTASPDKDTPHHDDGPLAVVAADGSEKNPHFSKYQTLADQLRGQPHLIRNFSISGHEQPCGHTEKVKPVMESVLLLPPHTNSDLRYCKCRALTTSSTRANSILLSHSSCSYSTNSTTHHQLDHLP
jgi:hypothetical protein